MHVEPDNLVFEFAVEPVVDFLHEAMHRFYCNSPKLPRDRVLCIETNREVFRKLIEKEAMSMLCNLPVEIFDKNVSKEDLEKMPVTSCVFPFGKFLLKENPEFINKFVFTKI